MKRFLLMVAMGLIWFGSIGMTTEQARDIYTARQCHVQYTSCDQVCYDCNAYCPNDDGVNVRVDPEVFLHYGEFKDQLSNQPQPQPPSECDSPPDPPIEPPTEFVGAVQGEDGVVALSSMDHATKIANETHAWVDVNGYMTSNPDSGVRIDFADGLTVGMTYNIRFVKSGIHYLWIEGSFVSPTSDSIHYGINGVRVGDMTFLNRTWSNQRQSATGRAELNIIAGDHVFNIYMREDGTPIRNIIITTDGNFVPQ